MNYKFRKVKLSEVDSIVKTVRDLLGKDFPYKPETIQAYKKISSKKHFSDVLRDKKSVTIGVYFESKMVGLIMARGEIGGVIYVYWLLVREDYRKKGIGSILMKKAEEWALAHKFHYMYLYTETDKNIDFYKKRGYVYIGRHENSWFGEIEHILGKQLRNKPFAEIFKNT